MTVYGFLAAFDPRATWPGLLSLVVGGCAAVALRITGPGSLALRQLTTAAAAALFGLAAFQCVLAASYLAFPIYLDYVEPATAAVSWVVWHGSPLYPPIGSNRFYAQVYGPFLYLGTGLVLELLGPSIATSKLPGLLTFGLGLLLCYRLLRRNGGRPIEALTITAALCVVLAGFGNQGYAFGARSDPWLFAAAAASALVATSKPSVAHAVALGALAGIATNFKADAVLYCAPTFLLLLSRTPAWAQRIRFTVLGIAAGAVFLAAPFSEISVADYLAVLRSSAQRPLLRWLAEQNVAMIAFELSPVLWLAAIGRRALPRGFIAFLAATAGCMLVVLVPASAEGAGPYHFLPFLPSLAWALLAAFHAALKSEAKVAPAILAMLAAAVLGYGPIEAASSDYILRAYARKTPVARRAAAEVVANHG